MTHFNADIERYQVGEQTIGRDLILLHLGGQTKAMKQTKDQGGGLGVRLEAKPTLIRPHIVERLVDDRQTDDRINDI